MGYIVDMDVISLVQFVQSTIKDRHASILNHLEASGISNMEQYQHCMGQLSALSYINQELSNLLEKQEQ